MRINSRVSVFVAAVLVSTGACTTVPPGYVGIKVNNYGANRGVADIPIVTGRVTYNPWSEDIYKFPTFYQNEIWTRNAHEGKAVDESITFNSVEGATVNCDIGISVSFEKDKVPQIFMDFRKEPEEIIDVYIRNQVRDAFSRHASTMKVVDIFGAGKQQLIMAVTKDLQDRLGPRGFLFDNISIVGELRVAETVQESINAVLSATQKAIEAENKVKQSQAEAEQAVAKSRGDSASAVIEATGKAEANRRLQSSLTSELIQYQTVQAWDGHLPMVTSGGTPLIQLPHK